MKFCPNCGANIEGLISWCDCCGAPLENDDYIILHAHDFQESGDIANIINAVVARLNQKELHTAIPSIAAIELETYCYPSALVKELNLRNRSRFSKKTNRATITIVFDYELYVNKTAREKEAYVEQTILSALSAFLKKIKIANLTGVMEMLDSVKH